MKHSRPIHGKSRADGKQQESSTNTEKTTRDQPGCKTPHHIPLAKKTYALAPGMSIDTRVMKPEAGITKVGKNVPKKCSITPMAMTKVTQRAGFSPIRWRERRKTSQRQRASIVPKGSSE